MNGFHVVAEALARQMIADHGHRASLVAAERLNECLDRGDKSGRDHWVQVVYEIHRLLEGFRPIFR